MKVRFSTRFLDYHDGDVVNLPKRLAQKYIKFEVATLVQKQKKKAVANPVMDKQIRAAAVNK